MEERKISLRELREHLDRSRITVAKALGVTPQTVGVYESGECCLRPGQILIVAELFKVPVETVVRAQLRSCELWQHYFHPKEEVEKKSLIPAEEIDAREMDLRELRKCREFSKCAVARALGVSVASIDNYERGLHPINVSQALILAKLFEVPTATVVDAQLRSCERWNQNAGHATDLTETLSYTRYRIGSMNLEQLLSFAEQHQMPVEQLIRSSAEILAQRRSRKKGY